MDKLLLAIAVAIAFSAVNGAQAAAPSQASRANPGVPLSQAQRSALVAQIVRTWGPYVERTQGTSAQAWARRMQATFDLANDGNLQRAASAKLFQGMVGALTGMHLSDARIIDSLATQAEVLKPQGGTEVLGSVTADLVYTPLSPCRIADTRVVGGPITGGTFRSYFGYTTSNFSGQGGNTTGNCGIPPNPSALVLDVTAVGATQPGYLTLWPYNTTQPVADNLDYPVGLISDNEVTAAMTTAQSHEFNVYANGTTNVVMDVVGYFMPPQATALDTTSVSASVTSFSFVQVNYPSCPATYARTGGYCSGGTGVTGVFLRETGPTYCEFDNESGENIQFFATTQCARVPGR